jgi:hypothetical protein
MTDDHQPFPRQLAVRLAGGVIDSDPSLLRDVSTEKRQGCLGQSGLDGHNGLLGRILSGYGRSGNMNRQRRRVVRWAPLGPPS